MAQNCTLRCSATQGIFDDEWVVTIRTARGDARSIVDRGSLLMDADPAMSGESRPARLKAYCVADHDDIAAVVLPQATIENGPTVMVPKSELMFVDED